MKLSKALYGAVILIGTLIWTFAFQLPDDNLHIIACDVGQGDAILITYQNIQILTDGGPNKKVMNCLNKYLPFWDREIELVILTHPDSDHSTGLIDVIKRYNVDTILANSIESGTDTYRVLENMVGSRGVEVLYPEEGMKLRLGLIYLDIFNPSHQMVSDLKEVVGENKIAVYKPVEKTNAYSIVYKLSFKDFTGLFTGDFEQDVSNRLAAENKIGKVNYIKVPHHGSRNGMTDNLLKAVDPKVAVISVGANNSYGHPTQGILDMLNKYGVKILRTDEMGDVIIETDGENYWIKN